MVVFVFYKNWVEIKVEFEFGCLMLGWNFFLLNMEAYESLCFYLIDEENIGKNVLVIMVG